MAPEQFQQLLVVLQKIADKPYTLTGAADWPMLMAMGGMVSALVLLMWCDLRGQMGENKKEHARIWQAQADCQDDCCPRGGRNEKRS